MTAGYRGTFVISVDQTETDGIRGAPATLLEVGSVWSWCGEAVRVDGPAGVLALDLAEDQEDLARRAARSVGRLVGLSRARSQRRSPAEDDAWTNVGFTVTDGLALYRLMPLDPVGRLLAVSGALPPRGADLSVIAVDLGFAARGDERPDTMTGFAAGTRIATPDGERAVEAIRAGDRVVTCDAGPQEVLWIGARRLSGARLYAMPGQSPVRIRAGALGGGRPEADLIVAPGHRVLIAGERASALFGADDVLICARDLVDGRQVVTEGGLREATYFHLMTARHEVIVANGLGAETFHPASTEAAGIVPAAGTTTGEALATYPSRYGGFARRRLTAPEVAILRYAET